MIVYVNDVAYAEHIALVKGDVSGDEPVLVRMHALNVLDDVLGDVESGKGGDLQNAMDIVGEKGRGVVVLIREPYARSLSDRVRRKNGDNPDDDMDTAHKADPLREYGVGAQILLDLGVKDLILLSNTQRTIVGIDGYDLNVVGQHPLPNATANKGPAQ